MKKIPWYTKVKVGDILEPLAEWNSYLPPWSKLKLKAKVKIEDINTTRNCQSGYLFKVKTKNEQAYLWLDANWFHLQRAKS